MKKIIGALAIAAIVGGGTYTASTAHAQSAVTSMRQQLTDAQKQILEQIKSLRDQGKDTEAESLAKANGLDKGFKNRPKPTEAQIESMKAIRTALENNDFTSFQTALKGTAVVSTVNESTFAELVKVHTLRKQAEEAQKAFADSHQDLMSVIGPVGHGHFDLEKTTQ